MTTITIFIDDPDGGDSSLLFPSASHNDIQSSSVFGSGASLEWSPYVNGVVDFSVVYQASFTGNSFEPGLDTRGNFNAATLTRSVDGGTPVQIAHATFSLDGDWQILGAVYIASWASLTPDALANQVSERTPCILSFVGNIGNDKLTGSFLGDIFDGGAGADKMIGGRGDDTYTVENNGDRVVEFANEGVDTINSAISLTLGAHVENLTLTTTNHLKATGNGLKNILTGNSANNEIDGKGGADRMTGLGGNDTYFVDHVGDVVVEATNRGNDTVRSSVGFSLTGRSIEQLVLVGSNDIIGLGNPHANNITGNAGSNILNGREGNDTLTGAGGIDFFRFSTALNASTNVDTVTDFQINVDKIQLENTIFAAIGAGLTADEFVANATGAAANSLQHILYDTTDGRLFYDADGNGGQAKVHFATLTAGLALDNLDFLVI